MKNQLRPIFTLFLFLTIITGVVYPLLVTGFSQVLLPFQANGSLIEHEDKPTGSKLIGQNFTDPQYFWGRPSATSGTPYNAFDRASLTGSSGSNLGPLSQSLFDIVKGRVELFHSADPDNGSLLPVDLVTASASGLDPHISVDAAYYQVHRVALARQLSVEEVTALVNQYIEKRQFGLLGEPRVNVFMLNLALDGIK